MDVSAMDMSSSMNSVNSFDIHQRSGRCRWEHSVSDWPPEASISNRRPCRRSSISTAMTPPFFAPALAITMPPLERITTLELADSKRTLAPSAPKRRKSITEGGSISSSDHRPSTNSDTSQDMPRPLPSQLQSNHPEDTDLAKTIYCMMSISASKGEDDNISGNNVTTGPSQPMRQRSLTRRPRQPPRTESYSPPPRSTAFAA
jgi:hypothetical protein